MRRADPEPLASRTAAMAARHVGGRPSLIDKDQSLGIRSNWPSSQACRRFTTSGRSCSAVWAVFFTRDRVPLEEALERAEAEGKALLRQSLQHLLDGPVGSRAKGIHNLVLSGVDPARLAVAAQSLWPHIAPATKAAFLNSMVV